MPAIERMSTVGQIAIRHGVSISRVQYVLRSRRIPAAGLAGAVRVFDDAAVAAIGEELRRIELRRTMTATMDRSGSGGVVRA